MSIDDYTRHQQRIIKNYYKNKGGVALQKLQELVTELYLAESEKKANQLWKRVEKALVNLEVEPERIAHLMETRDPAILAENVKDWWQRSPGEKRR